MFLNEIEYKTEMTSLIEYLMSFKKITEEELKEIDSYLISEAKRDLMVIFESINILFEDEPKPEGKISKWKNAAKEKVLGKLKASREYVGAAFNKLPKSGKYAVGAAGIAAVGIGGTAIYKRYMAKAARVCSGLKGAERKDCIDRYKKAAKAAAAAK